MDENIISTISDDQSTQKVYVKGKKQVSTLAYPELVVTAGQLLKSNLKGIEQQKKLGNEIINLQIENTKLKNEHNKTLSQKEISAIKENTKKISNPILMKPDIKPEDPDWVKQIKIQQTDIINQGIMNTFSGY